MNVILTLPWLSAIAVPLLAAALLTRRASTPLGVVLAPWTAAPALFLAVFEPPAAEVPWLLLGTHFGLDPVGRMFLLAASIIWFCGGLFAQSSIRAHRRRRFFSGYLLALAGNVGAIVAQDVASFYLFFALMSYAAYALVIRQDDQTAARAARTYIVFTILAELALLAGMFLVVPEMPSLRLAALGPTIAGSPHHHLLTTLFLVGFAGKAGAIGLHMWMPPAYDAAPASAGALLSGAMAKVGLLGWLRFLPLGQMSEAWGACVATVGLVAAFFGVIVGLTQRSPKAILAYSSISQMGLMMMAVGGALLAPAASKAVGAAAIYALHHGLAKASLFTGTGLSRYRFARGSGAVVVAGLLVPGLSLAGAPLTSGAMAKHALEGALKETSSSWIHDLHWPLSLAAAATLVLLLHFWRRVRAQAARVSTPPPPASSIGWLLVTLTSAALVWSLPWLHAPELARETLAPKGLWKSTWPVLVGLAVFASGLALGRRRRVGIPSLPPGDLLIPLRAVVGALGSGSRSIAAVAQTGWHAGLSRTQDLREAVTAAARRILEIEDRIGWTQAVALLLVLLATMVAVVVLY